MKPVVIITMLVVIIVVLVGYVVFVTIQEQNRQEKIAKLGECNDILIGHFRFGLSDEAQYANEQMYDAHRKCLAELEQMLTPEESQRFAELDAKINNEYDDDTIKEMPDSFAQLNKAMQEYETKLESASQNSNKDNPSKYKQWDDRHIDNYHVRLFWDLDKCAVDFKEKRLGEESGFESCMERLQPKIEFFCSRYSQENCIETTNQELSDWLGHRYANGEYS